MVCGPNGAGKSTFTRTLVMAQNFICIDPDAIAANGLSPLAAGKAAASMAKLLLQQKVSFVRESTLTSHFDFHLMEEAKRNGYQVRLVYIALRSAELALSRVKSRVSKGGHDVPEADVVRRYHRSRHNLPKALALADSFTILDNSDQQYSVIDVSQILA
ncbi:MAG: zeta toxin family protein [Mailhella sp.]|nr:zeta toxin family protein [Mailhella sp.]